MSMMLVVSAVKNFPQKFKPWYLSTEDLPVFRGRGDPVYRIFLPKSRDYFPIFVNSVSLPKNYQYDPAYSRLLLSRSGHTIIASCQPEKDEKILLISLANLEYGRYRKFSAYGAEILFNNSSSACRMASAHLVVRLLHPLGYVVAESGEFDLINRVEIISWTDYRSLSLIDFGTWQMRFLPELNQKTREEANLKAEKIRSSTLALWQAKKEAEKKDRLGGVTALQTVDKKVVVTQQPALQIIVNRNGKENLRDGWVIKPNGYHRKPDEILPETVQRAGEIHVWSKIFVEDFILTWHWLNPGIEPEIEVKNFPLNLTSAQRSEIQSLETKLRQRYHKKWRKWELKRD